jgi:nitroimidazol reductase NimA-like FMN-containing flavoprotein (pyridoxamine 5'-phosphate oxidase superfamily)
MSDLQITKRSRLRRSSERGHFDRPTVNAILDAGLLCHVGYVIDAKPYVTPTFYWRDGDQIYWHGSSASRMIRQANGADVCLTVTHLDGLVLARSGFHHSVNYRSVMLFGRAEKVTGREVKERILDQFVDLLYPGRSAEIRPSTTQEMKATTVLRMPIEEGSAKIRAGGPVDDEDDYALPVWAGVVPLAMVAGVPEPDDRLSAHTPVPAHVSGLARKRFR